MEAETFEALPETLFKNYADGEPESFTDCGKFAPMRIESKLSMQLLVKEKAPNAVINPAMVILNVFSTTDIERVQQGEVVKPLWVFTSKIFSADNIAHLLWTEAPFSSKIHPIDPAADLALAISAINHEACLMIKESTAVAK